MCNILKLHGEIKDESTCLDYIAGLSGTQKEELDTELISVFSSRYENGIRYFDERGNQVDEVESAKFKIVATGYVTKSYGVMIKASFKKSKTNGKWYGACIGTEDKLLRLIKDRLQEDEEITDEYIEQAERKALCPMSEFGCTVLDSKWSDVRDAIMSSISNKEIFDTPKFSFDSQLDKCDRLASYLEIFICRAMNLMKSGRSNELVLTNAGTGDYKYLYLNTGLMNTYMENICVIVKISISKNYSKIMEMVRRKSSLIRYGFTQEQAVEVPRKIKFHDKIEQLMFCHSIKEFDLENLGRNRHIIYDRHDRLPASVAKLPEDRICSRIKEAVSAAMRIAEGDAKYIVPVYSLTRNTIDYLIPIYFDNNMTTDKPELVGILNLEGGFIEMATVITLSDAYDYARPISAQAPSWLRIV